MKKKMKALVAVVALTFAGVAMATVLSASEDLAEGLEHLDSELHRIGAHHHVIEHVHHTEETCFEFVDLVVNQAPYQSLYNEFQHIKTDMREIRNEMRAHNYYSSARVRQEFWHAWTAYRYLDHEFYHPRGSLGGGRIHH